MGANVRRPSPAVTTSKSNAYVGAHYPGDVVGGAALGGAVALGVWALSERRPAALAIERVFILLRRLRLAA